MAKKAVIDQMTQNGIFAVIALGCTIETAAQYFKCDPNLIYKEIKKNKNFAAEIKWAQQQAEVYYVKQIKNAAQHEKNWRAATWFLERLKPNRYGKNKTHMYSFECVREFLKNFAMTITKEITSSADKDRINKKLNKMIAEFADLQEQAKTKNVS